MKLSGFSLISALLLAGTFGFVGGAPADDYDLDLHVFPNPFIAGRLYGNAEDYAQVAFKVPSGGTASVYIYDFDGTLIRTLFEGIRYGPGDHAEEWDGRDDGGDVVGPGPYVAILELNIGGITYRDTFVAVAHR